MKRNHLVIENEEHRNLLIRECKYYRFLELEQQIIKYKILNNPFAQDGCNKQEIIISLKDLNPKGLVNESPKDGSKEVALEYRRPYLIKEPKRTLIFQIDSGCNDIFNKDYSEVKLIINRTVKVAVLQITNKICLKMVQVFKNICDDFIIKENETGYPQTTILVGLKDSKSIVNGMTMRTNWIGDLLGDVEKEKESEEDEEAPSKKRKIDGDIIEFRLTKSLWRMMIRGNRLRLHCISFEGLTDQSSFIKQEIDFI